MQTTELRLKVNGDERRVPLDPPRSLLAVLREDLDLTGTKYGCGEGECGACTVLLDGAPVRACRIAIDEVGDRPVVTVEGLSPAGALTSVQRAFAELGAFQCGYCTPGMIVGATALLREDPSPTPAAIRAALDGHLCRCCGYARIVRAVARAAEIERSKHGGP